MITRIIPILQSPERQEEGDVLTVVKPDEPGSGGTNYRVILYNDDVHTVDEVIVQLMKATECDLERAVNITLEVDNKGRAVCFRGERAKCHKVTRVLREINLQCEVDCD
ncbi:ATP-dependent Clp protease adaptor ClpS [bacterium]|nr:MAG: ATP-dependent Clp protease adaptor ClpS [bacterium]